MPKNGKKQTKQKTNKTKQCHVAYFQNSGD